MCQEKIFNHCFNRENAILLTKRDENVTPFLTAILASTPLTLFETDKNTTFNEHQRFRENYVFNETHFRPKIFPTTSVTVIVPSTGVLVALLKATKDSIWWNHEARFLIINPKRNGCQTARLILSTLWEFNILSATYLSREQHDQPLLYTFNPYTSFAPTFWRNVQDNSFSNNRWTLLEHTLEESNTLAHGEYIYNIEREINV